MTVLETRYRLCECCMKEHEVQIVSSEATGWVKGEEVGYNAIDFYCPRTGSFFDDEEMLEANDIAMKDAYRRKVGLLSVGELKDIRAKYRITQKDLSLILNWGGKTITRYESHQIQDSAHDTILRKLESDPEWFISLLNQSRDLISEDAYNKYMDAATRTFSAAGEKYLRSFINARYAPYAGNKDYTGGKTLSVDVVKDMIRYLAGSPAVRNLYTVKLMKMLWYCDALSFKRRGVSMTGLVYRALPMGAVPEAYEEILCLDGIPYVTEPSGETAVRRFTSPERKSFPTLDPTDTNIIDAVISHFGRCSKDEIVEAMHKEDAFIHTRPSDVIPYSLTATLSLE